jgi:hypothetical protein
MPNPFALDEQDKIRQLKAQVETTVTFKLLELPAMLWELLMEKSILTGGAISSIVHKENVNDYDLYLNDHADITKFNELLKDPDVIAKVQDVNPKYMADVLIDGKLVTSRAVTFKNKLQVITMNTSDARKTFDYVHCMPYFDIKNKKLYISRMQFDAIKHKKLVKNVNGQTNYSMEEYRKQKFIDRGWKL